MHKTSGLRFKYLHNLAHWDRRDLYLFTYFSKSLHINLEWTVVISAWPSSIVYKFYLIEFYNELYM